MGQYLTAAGKETCDKTAAATDPQDGQARANAARNVWVTATALTTALNTSYFAKSVALFAILMGVALLLIGVGLVVLSVRWLIEPDTAVQKTPTVVPKPAVA
jgi:high-affinity Fe2+/Pb2+ permease